MSGPDPGAAMRQGGAADSMTGLLATGATGRDGQFWRAVSD